MSIQDVRAHLATHPAPDALDALRAQYEKAERFFKLPSGVVVEPVRVGALPAEWLRPAGARADATVLYLHGGGYAIGSAKSHRHVAAAIAKAAGTPALLVDYRRAPEHPFPAAVEDAVASYRWLLGTGHPSRRIVVAGDSAGGGLTVATLVALRDAGTALPAAGVCISPWVDLTCGGASYQTKAASDPLVTREGVARMAVWYLAGADPKTPLAPARRPPRPAAAARSRRQRGGAARRRPAAGNAGRGRRRGGDPRRLARDGPRLALVPRHARRGPGRRRRDRCVRRRESRVTKAAQAVR